MADTSRKTRVLSTRKTVRRAGGAFSLFALTSEDANIQVRLGVRRPATLSPYLAHAQRSAASDVIPALLRARSL